MDTSVDMIPDNKLKAQKVNVFYAEKQALYDVTLGIDEKSVTSFIGPSGCGKSTFLRCFNRMNDVIPSCRVQGQIFLDDVDLNSPKIDPVLLRARIGMVFQKPNPFPKTVYENVAYGPRIHGLAANRQEMDYIVEDSLKKAGLWKEVSDRLNDQATGLSGGQLTMSTPMRLPASSGRHKPGPRVVFRSRLVRSRIRWAESSMIMMSICVQMQACRASARSTRVLQR